MELFFNKGPHEDFDQNDKEDNGNPEVADKIID